VNLLKVQQCPHCNESVEDNYAEWEEGTHEVECNGCKRIYQVEPIYEFQGFKVQKFCDGCKETEEDCCCDIEESEEKE
jgi:hypothetical protein